MTERNELFNLDDGEINSQSEEQESESDFEARMPLPGLGDSSRSSMRTRKMSLLPGHLDAALCEVGEPSTVMADIEMSRSMIQESRQTSTKDCLERARCGPCRKQSESEEKPKTRAFYVNDRQRNVYKNDFHSNYVRTTKYTKWNFLPLSIAYQFKRLANAYFLGMAILNCIPRISALDPVTSISPLVIVLMISIVREGIEDFLRYSSDKETNGQKVKILRNGEFADDVASSIVVGDIVMIQDDEVFPADMILISSSTPDGICFIQTSSLDGEKNLKKRKVSKGMEHFVPQATLDADQMIFVGECEADQPSNLLYTFTGKIRLGRRNFPLTADQLLLKGTNLKNTKWILGFAVYTGVDTRLMQNSQEGRVKMSNMEGFMNVFAIQILIAQLILCVVGAVLGGYWYETDRESQAEFHYYLSFQSSQVWNSFFDFFRYLQLLNTLIPISLFVTVELMKGLQSLYIYWDHKMYSHERDTNATVKNPSIIEDLGQVGFIFSDKTGTLTRNDMEFKAMCVGKVLYESRENAESGKEEFDTALFEQHMMGQNAPPVDITINSKNGSDQYQITSQRQLLTEFLKVLSLAHEAVPEKSSRDENTIIYRGPSPDEITLVEFARELGFTFKSGDDRWINLEVQKREVANEELEEIQMEFDHSRSNEHSQGSGNTPLRFELFRRVEFNSDRKRMSILIKDPEDGKIKLYVKGADSIVMDRLDKDTVAGDERAREFLDQVQDFTDVAARTGLRTLLIAMKIVDKEEFHKFFQDVNKAEEDVVNREKLLDKIYSDLESDLTLLGATAVEDRLQDEVPDTIAAFQEANIKVWMLTGDKFETAENIAFSCKLIKPDYFVFKLQTKEDVKKFCSQATIDENNALQKQGRRRGLIVAASMLAYIFSDVTFKVQFLRISKTCDAVVCCRVSPSQKADVVRLIKDDDKEAITLAIGDGANDVSMIKEAHIGVGLYGNEGLRAAQTADFALGEFKFMHRLLLVHGRLTYLRNSEVILYYYYKNIVFTLPQFHYAFYNGFSAMKFSPDDWYIQLFNLVFTQGGLIAKAVFDYDINSFKDDEPLKSNYPKLYYLGQDKLLFNRTTFLQYQFLGVAHSAIAFFIPVYTYMRNYGQPTDFAALSLTIFTAVIVIVNVEIAVKTRVVNFLTVGGFAFNALYFPWVWLSNEIDFSHIEYAVPVLHEAPLFYAVIAVTVVACGAVDFFMEAYRVLITRTPSDFLRSLDKDDVPLQGLEAHEFEKLCKEAAEKARQKRFNVERALDIRRSQRAVFFKNAFPSDPMRQFTALSMLPNTDGQQKAKAAVDDESASESESDSRRAESAEGSERPEILIKQKSSGTDSVYDSEEISEMRDPSTQIKILPLNSSTKQTAAATTAARGLGSQQPTPAGIQEQSDDEEQAGFGTPKTDNQPESAENPLIKQ